MLLLYRFILLMLSIEVLCSEGNMEHTELWSALASINDLRYCSIINKYSHFKLPEVLLNGLKSNWMVNQLVKERHTLFWKELRQHDYRRYARRMVERSKGAAIDLQFSLNDTSSRKRVTEAQLLEPYFSSRSMQKLYLKCLISKGVDVLECLKCLIEDLVEDDLEREMILCALWFLEIAVDVSSNTHYHLSDRDLMSLRSDYYALHCIRDWDRLYSIPKLVYLTFLLNARILLAQLANDFEQWDKVSRMRMAFEQLVNAEFPSNLMREVRREMIDSGSLTLKHQDKRVRRVVSELRLLLVQQALDDDYTPTMFLEGTTAYLSIAESYREDSPGAKDQLFNAVVGILVNRDFVINRNPSYLNIKEIPDDEACDLCGPLVCTHSSSDHQHPLNQ